MFPLCVHTGGKWLDELYVTRGTRCGLAPGRLRRPPPEGRPPDAAPRRFSLLARNRLWARVWLTSVPGPNLAADLRCLSPPATA